MKIGLVLPYSISLGGGVKEYVLAIQDELQRRGHTAIVITPHPRNYQDEPPEDVIFLGGSTDFRSPFHTTAQVSVTVSPDRVEEVLEEEKFDVLHFHEPWVPVIGRQILSRSEHIPNVATFHAKLPDTLVSRTIEKVVTPYTKSIMKYLDVLTAVSSPAAVYVRQLTTRRVELVPNGIDLGRYKPDASLPRCKAPTIFYVGRLEKRKGVRYLLKAFADLQQSLPEACLVIGGNGPDREQLEEYVEEESINNVTFLGYVTDEEKIRWLQTADVFCSPAVFGESFGIVLLESIACGIPTVAGANAGYEYVLQGRGAIGLVNPKETADFSRRLKLLLTDEVLRNAWKEWASDYITQFSYDKIVDRYEELYHEAIQKAHHPRSLRENRSAR